jgi:hypothetical protein
MTIIRVEIVDACVIEQTNCGELITCAVPWSGVQGDFGTDGMRAVAFTRPKRNLM